MRKFCVLLRKFLGISRKAGDIWMVHGPCKFVPSIHLEVVEHRAMICLDENQGKYVRDLTTGNVRVVQGPQSYMLKEEETLWSKQLSPEVCVLLQEAHTTGGLQMRTEKVLEGVEKVSTTYTDVVTLNCPPNTAIQVYNFREKVSRVILGPQLVELPPDEQLTVTYLSGGKPKKPNQIMTLGTLLLGLTGKS